MTKTITSYYVIDVYVNSGRSIVKLSADVWYGSKKQFEFYPYGKKYAYDGESTINDFIEWFLIDLVKAAAEIGIDFYECKINKHYI
jgi:hypothetical protein